MKYPRRLCFIILLLFGLIATVHSADIDDHKLLIAPMVGGLDLCIYNHDMLENGKFEDPYSKSCLSDPAYPSKLIRETLNSIYPKARPSEKYRFGYTLVIPILRLFDYKGGVFVLNQSRLKRYVNIIASIDRPVVIYLFSNHYSSHSDVEEILSGDPENLLKTSTGPLPIDLYYGIKIIPWSFANTTNNVTKLRIEAVDAILKELCTLSDQDKSKISGLILLGELFHMFPDFANGMGYPGKYITTDYSATSIKNFRKFLSNKYLNIKQLNLHLNSNYLSFDQIYPPGTDHFLNSIKSTDLNYIDNYAAGVLPVSGWVAPKGNSSPTDIAIYVDKRLVSKAKIKYARPDVIAVHSQLKTDLVGWRHDIDISHMPSGIHCIEIYANFNDKSIILDSKSFHLKSNNNSTTHSLNKKCAGNRALKKTDDVLFSIDNPKDNQSFIFNPLAKLWNSFRGSQIKSYIDLFYKISIKSCVKRDLIYAFQIIPFVYPEWDTTKYGIDDDLSIPSGVGLGISLYGDPMYNLLLNNWLKEHKNSNLGVVEFHPLKKIPPDQLNTIISKYRIMGIKYLSFFMEHPNLPPGSKDVGNPLSIHPNNLQYGSNFLFESMHKLLAQ